jgi:hypothetical protein
MAIYINPLAETAESFLEREGTLWSNPEHRGSIPAGYLPVLLQDRGSHDVAFVPTTEQEFHEGLWSPISLSVVTYIVPTTRLVSVCQKDVARVSVSGPPPADPPRFGGLPGM